MDTFLEKYNISKLNKEEVQSLNRSITVDEIEAIIKKLLACQIHGPDSFPGEFYKKFKEDLTPVLQRLLKKFKWEDSQTSL